MPQNPKIVKRYTEADAALTAMIRDVGQVPLPADQEAVVREYVYAATAYAEDLELNDHAVPGGLRDKIARMADLLA